MRQRIATLAKTKEVIAKNQFHLKKAYGQNFLIDKNILDKIVDAAQISEQDCVLEIGPGIGSLTQEIAERAKKVVAVEIDKNLIPILQETLIEYPNVKIINQDILKVDVNALLLQEFGTTKVKVVANLPYYITTPILMGLLEKKAPVASITVMVQKEVAQRMQAGAGEAAYGALSVAVGYYCKAEIAMIVSPSCFIPPPKVASAVITLHVLTAPSVEVAEEALYFNLVKCAFGQRRKTLLNCIYNQAGLGFSKEEIAQILNTCGFSEKVRGETLSVQDFGVLCNRIYACMKT